MKKLFTIAIALLAINIYAQKITFGAKAGLNFSKLKVDAPEYEKYPSITSFQIGVTSKKEISGSNPRPLDCQSRALAN